MPIANTIRSASILTLALALLSGCEETREGLPTPTGPGTISVTVVDYASSPVEGAEVTVTPGDMVLITDDFGSAFFSDLEPSAYQVTARHGTLGAARQSINLSPGELEQLTLTIGEAPVVPGSPTVTILSPDSGQVFAPGETVTLRGTVVDDRDSPYSLRANWESSIDGPLGSASVSYDGTTQPVQVVLTPGAHSITLKATDQEGHEGRANTTAVVGDPANLPDAVVLSPIEFDASGATLTWTRATETEPFTYRVQRAVDSGGFEVVEIISDPDTLTFRQTGLQFGVTYSYRIGVYRQSDGLEAVSNVEQAVLGTYIDVATQVEDMLVDPSRPYLYALDRVNNSLHFVNLNSLELESTIFVGSSPVDMDLSLSGDELFIANFGSTEIAVVDLTTRQRSRSIFVDVDQGTWEGNPYRLACTTGNTLVFTSEDQWNNIKLVDAATGSHIAVAGSVYQPDLVANPDGTAVYVAESGSSGSSLIRFDVTPTGLSQVDESTRVSGYGSRLATMSADGRYIFYARTKFLASNLASQLGVFSEFIYASNADGSVVFGNENIFNGETFSILRALPLTSTIMALSADEATLYLYDETTSRIYLYDVSDLGS